jgi:hypothetical protein
LLLLRGDLSFGEHLERMAGRHTNPTASPGSWTLPRSAAAASATVSSASGSACNRSSGIGRPLRTDRR